MPAPPLQREHLNSGRVANTPYPFSKLIAAPDLAALTTFYVLKFYFLRCLSENGRFAVWITEFYFTYLKNHSLITSNKKDT